MANSIPLVTAFSVLEPGDRSYPRRLNALGWRHAIHLRGAKPSDGAAVAVVGARAATAEGMKRAFELAAGLAGRGVHVVSGGALGIDGAAHRGALAGGGTTTVVLGSGIDVPYPARHVPLFDRVVAQGGALVSMLPLGTAPRPHTFPQRNPLIAALADVVIVVEADLHSGSLSTAKAGVELGRVVAAYPGSRGCERLLASGAALVETCADALAALAGQPRTVVREVAPLDPQALAVQRALADGVRGVDSIVSATGLPVRVVLRALGVLELSGSARSL